MVSMVRKRVIVSGLVQGVFYRDSCQRQAAARGVAGWVRNRSDGTVEAVFEGPADAVDRLVGWARRGPSRAIVSDITVTEEPPEGLTGRVREETMAASLEETLRALLPAQPPTLDPRSRPWPWLTRLLD